MKRFISILVSLLIVFGTFAVCAVSAEDNAAKLTLNGKEYSAEKGDKVVYKLEVESAQLIECAQFVIFYPKDVLKAESGELKNVSNKICNLGVVGEVNCNFSSPSNFDFKEKKTLLEVEFSVTDGGEGAFSKTVKGFYNPNDKKITENLELFESIEITKPPTEQDTTEVQSEPESSTAAETSSQQESSTVSEETQNSSGEVTSATETSEQIASDDTAATDSTEATKPEEDTIVTEATNVTDNTDSTDATENTKATDAAENTKATEPSEKPTGATLQPTSTEGTFDTSATAQTEAAETVTQPYTQSDTTEATDPAEETVTPENNKPAKVKEAFLPLKARAVKTSKTAVKLSWSKVKNASSYAVYGAKAKGKYKLLKNVKAENFTVKKLKKGTYYKFCIAALDSEKNMLAKSQAVISVTRGSKYADPTAVKANKKVLKLKAKKSCKLKVKLTLPDGKKIKLYKKTAFVSTNPKIAAVNAKGKVTAKKKGRANIYVYAQNGLASTVKVIVK